MQSDGLDALVHHGLFDPLHLDGRSTERASPEGRLLERIADPQKVPATSGTCHDIGTGHQGRAIAPPACGPYQEP